MSIAIYVLEKSIVDFAGSVVAVAGDGSGITFDAPHLHETVDREGTARRQRARRFFIVGTREDAAQFGATLDEVRRMLKRVAVPMMSTKPIINSDGIAIRQYIVYKTAKAELLIPKVFSGLSMGTAVVDQCGQESHIVVRALGYDHCPMDGTRLRPFEGTGIYQTFLKEKHRISEIRVEEPTARKACEAHSDGRFPNVFSHCPRCGGNLFVAKKHAPRGE